MQGSLASDNNVYKTRKNSSKRYASKALKFGLGSMFRPGFIGCAVVGPEGGRGELARRKGGDFGSPYPVNVRT